MTGLVHWVSRGHQEDLQAPIPMPQPLWKALLSRNFNSQDKVQSLFSPSLADLKNPFSILGIKEASCRLYQAYQSSEKIAIYADFDLDGTSGLALLYTGLIELGFQNIVTYQPKRLSEGYGLHSHAVEELAQQGVRVIVTVDVGVTAVEPAKKAHELGIDLIITDHHQVGEVLPEAFCIINPNQEACPSGLGYLCGAGVAFYLLLAVRKTFSQNGHTVSFNPKDVLDFFVIGTLTDLVPLVEDNRVLVKHGLTKLSETQRPALRLLLDALGFSERSLTSQDVAIMIAPKLNALSRMETTYLPRHVLLETDTSKSQEIVEHVLQTQEMRKTYQRTAVAKAFTLADELNQKGYCWVWSHEFHKGVIGLVATQIAEKYRVPAFVGSVTEEGVVVGSARLPDGSSHSLIEILGACKQSLIQFGGHIAAAGFKLKLEQALELDSLMKNYFEVNPSQAIPKTFIYDSTLQLSDMNPVFMNWLYSLEPYGKDFPQFVFRIQKCLIVRKKNMNGGHLRWSFDDGTGVVLDGVMFSAPDEIHRIESGETVDILVEPQWNYFNGNKKIQLMIRDIRPHAL